MMRTICASNWPLRQIGPTYPVRQIGPTYPVLLSIGLTDEPPLQNFVGFSQMHFNTDCRHVRQRFRVTMGTSNVQ